MGEGGGEFGEFAVGGAVVGGGLDVLGGAAELEQPVLEVGEFVGGQDHGVLGQSAALDGRASFVGALSAGLAAVAAGSSDPVGVRQWAAAPAAVPDVAGGAAGAGGIGGLAAGGAGHGGRCGVHGR